MPYLPLKLPPGVVRPGTAYDAAGRWYGATLVRWHENAMQAVGGWQSLDRITAAVASCQSDNGGVFTDETTDANDADTADAILIPDPPTANDAVYIGAAYPFAGVDVEVNPEGVGNVVAWEYWNGSAWTALSGVVDPTDSFNMFSDPSGAGQAVTFTKPSNWVANTVNSVGPYYYIRARVTTGGSDAAYSAQIWIADGQVDVDGRPSGMAAWRANDETSQLAIGTEAKLWNYAGGVLTDITPASFSAGGADAVLASATYGTGIYGSGVYGTGDTSQQTLVEAQNWSLDTYGEDLVAVAYSDGQLLYWDKSAGGLAAALTNAPTSNLGVVVTPERFIVALGASGDGRLVKWCDQDDPTDWTAGATDQAGDYNLPGAGQIMAGRRGRSETLIWTDIDVFAMRYIGGTFVYRFEQVGSSCGLIARRAVAMVDGKAFWMGQRGFYGYDGYARPVPCDVGDYVFNDLNRTQASKIWVDTRSEYNEVTWYYPSGGSSECDRYVTFNYAGNFWSIGMLQRTAGVDRGAFSYPLMADAAGLVYQHEVGTSYNDHNGDALTPYAESGPIELGAGDNVMHVRQIVPDEKTLGDLRLYVYSSFYPTQAETTHGPYTAANPTSVRMTGRQVRLKAEQVTAGWRLGTPRLEVTTGGLR